MLSPSSSESIKHNSSNDSLLLEIRDDVDDIANNNNNSIHYVIDANSNKRMHYRQSKLEML